MFGPVFQSYIIVFSLGVMAFIGLSAFFMSRSTAEIQLEEKLVFMCFFAGAIICMGLSFLYHTLCCHKDKKIGRLFAKFDYCGIAFLTVGSFVPWLYYSFYCDWKPQLIYLSIVILLGIGAVVVSTFDFFAGPRFRPLRAGTFSRVSCIIWKLNSITNFWKYINNNS